MKKPLEFYTAQKLVISKSTGIIATHDLSLCEIENTILMWRF